jgi:ferredoxin-nitrite reductase
MFEVARLADVYGNGEIRLTVEENLIIPYVQNENIDAFLTEPILERYSTNPAPLSRSLISCTGARYCNFALIETKQRGIKLAAELDNELNIPERVRIHWTGCPNSCGQVQAADIGLMGTKAKKDGKVVEGVNLFTGGKVGKDAHLGSLKEKSIPCDDLKSVLRDLLIKDFGATLKEGVAIEDKVVLAPVSTETTTENFSTSTINKIFFSQSWKEVEVSGDIPILDAAEAQGLEIENSCRAGTCGVCAGKLLKGEVKYDSDCEAASGLEEGYILTCSAKPVGNVVVDL